MRFGYPSVIETKVVLVVILFSRPQDVHCCLGDWDYLSREASRERLSHAICASLYSLSSSRSLY